MTTNEKTQVCEIKKRMIQEGRSSQPFLVTAEIWPMNIAIQLSVTLIREILVKKNRKTVCTQFFQES